MLEFFLYTVKNILFQSSLNFKTATSSLHRLHVKHTVQCLPKMIHNSIASYFSCPFAQTVGN